MTKITIFSGFLGAGKTTLIKKLLAEGYKGEKVVLIENEFGEIGIDGGFVKDAGIEVTEMNSGCICCSLVGDFEKALAKVMDEFHPDRILIEPSGVGKLSDVIAAVKNARADAELAGFVTVADAKRCRMYMKNFGEFYNNQIENASAVILSRTQEMSDEKLAAAAALIREKNPRAPIVTTPWDELTGAQLVAVADGSQSLAEELMAEVRREHDHHHDHEHHHEHGEECHCPECEHEHHHDHDHDHEHDHHHDHDHECGCGHDHHHHHGHVADEVFESFGAETPHVFTEDELRAAFRELDTQCYGAILRAKGIVRGENGVWLHFDFVPGEGVVRTGAADYTGRVCVIGSNLDREGLRGLFEA